MMVIIFTPAIMHTKSQICIYPHIDSTPEKCQLTESDSYVQILISAMLSQY